MSIRVLVAIAICFGVPLSFGKGGGGHSGAGSHSSASHSGVVSHASGPVHVSGYTKKNGTVVQPHYRSAPDGTKANNWSTKGNVNPYTGKAGTKSVSGSSISSSGRPPARGNAEQPSDEERPIAISMRRAENEPQPTVSVEHAAPIISSGKAAPDPILEFQRKNAAKGSPESMRAMGLRYLDGNGVEEDPLKAQELLKKAAYKGDLPAQRKLKELKFWPE